MSYVTSSNVRVAWNSGTRKLSFTRHSSIFLYRSQRRRCNQVKRWSNVSTGEGGCKYPSPF